ncbi:hypothetical protein BVRB_5g110410 [Beta vulgaris subsp. vulgaris]|nr:hypothetical protein BVRB_5g110410 [Beta vulgaris subsp. vulgaris]
MNTKRASTSPTPPLCPYPHPSSSLSLPSPNLHQYNEFPNTAPLIFGE